MNLDYTEENGLLEIGETINSYVIKAKFLTTSGEAEIYLCEKENKKYVLKYYFNCKPKKEVIEKLKQISNPNVVTLYEYGEFKNHFFEIMEYAEGGALNSKDENDNYKYLPVKEENAIQIVRECVNAFNDCHKKGIIHRDIKPGNLFYKNKDGSNILIGDFGISSYYDVEDGMSKHLTQSTARTEGYTAPEVYTGIIGPEIDYYSLGVTLWELLTAKDPFMTKDEKPMFTAAIINETTLGRMADLLLSRSQNLSQKMKSLIKGLMTVRHDKRWDYDKVTRFLNGEDIPVYEEVNDIPSIVIGDKECRSYKEIAQTLITDYENGKNFVYKGNLTRYLVKINKAFANEIADKIDEYTASKNLDEGVYYIAHKLCPNLEFKLTEKTSFSSLQDLQTILETKPKEVLPHLTSDSKNFYLFLKIMGFEELSKTIWQMSREKYDYLLTKKIIIAMNGNSIAPFNDGKNNNIILSDINQLKELSPSLQERILLMIDAKNMDVCAWIELQSGKKINEWRQAFSELKYNEKEMFFSKWELFSYYMGFSSSLELVINEGKLFANIKYLKEEGCLGILDELIEKIINSLFDNDKFNSCLKLIEIISDKNDKYIVTKGKCLYELHQYSESYDTLELALKKGIRVVELYKYCAQAAYQNDRYDRALYLTNEALKEEPNSFDLLRLKSRILMSLERYEDAIVTLTMALDIREKYDLYMDRALCYEFLSIRDEAPNLKDKSELDRENARKIVEIYFSSEFENEYRNCKKNIDYRSEYSVGVSTDCKFSSIQMAIDSVPEGSTIYIKPGIYRENIKFSKSVTIIGCQEYIGNKSSKELPIVVMGEEYSCKIDVPVNIAGVVFTQSQELRFDKLRDYVNKEEEIEEPENPGGYGKENFQTILWVDAECNLKNIAVINGENYGITFSSGTSVLEYSFVGKTKDNGLYCRVNSSPQIKFTNFANCRYPNVYLSDRTIVKMDNCNIYNSQSSGFFVGKDSDCTLRDCFIYNNRDEGIEFSGNSQGNVFDCDIYNNKMEGVIISDNANPTVTGCEIYDNKSEGVEIGKNANPTVTCCKIYNNEMDGVEIGKNAKPTVTGCEIYKNGMRGVFIRDNAAPRVIECDIHNNKFIGVEFRHNAAPKFTDCKIHDSESGGVDISDNANPTVTGCEIYDNKLDGVYINDNANPTVTDCEIYDNKENGILIEGNATPKIAGCKIHDNKTKGERYPGVVASGDSSPTIRDCEIYNHLSCGLWIKENAGGTYRNCEIYNNDGGINNETSKSVDTSSCECWEN